MLSVIISTWNSMKYLPQCIESFLSLGINSEIIVIDSNSHDGIDDYMKQINEKTNSTMIKCLQKETWSDANQTGLTLSHGEWVCLCNPDIIFTGDFKMMYDYLQKSNGIFAAAPQLVYPDGVLQTPAKTITPELSLEAHTRIVRIILKRNPDYKFKYFPEIFHNDGCIAVPSPQGSLFMVHRKVIDDFDGHLWKPGYMNGVSDFDAFINMKNRGFPIYLFPDRKVIHYGSYISKKYPSWIEKDQAYGLVLYFRRNKLSNKISPGLYSILFGLEGIAMTGLDIIGKVIKRKNKFFNPKLSAWRTGQRILGLIDGWKYKIEQ